MSDVNYETAWKRLKRLTGIIVEISIHFAGSEDQYVDERLRSEGGVFVGRRILRFMDDTEKEMDTNAKENETLND